MFFFCAQNNSFQDLSFQRFRGMFLGYCPLIGEAEIVTLNPVIILKTYPESFQ